MRSPNQEWSAHFRCCIRVRYIPANGAWSIALHSQSSSPASAHRLLSSRFPSGNIDWSKVCFNDFVQFLTSEFARMHNRATQTAWLMILRSLVRYLSYEGHIPPGWDAAWASIVTRKHISLPRGLHRNRCGRFGQPVKVGGPATSVTGRYCWFSSVSGFAPRRSPTSHLPTSIGGLGA